MNNKMKKFNKILMMTVAILLTLVLASTSVVSGIFAKYVVTKKATTTVSLQKFGLTLTVDAGGYGKVTENPDGATGLNVLSITVDNLELIPGQPLTDVIKFSIDGSASVDNVDLKITTKVEDYTPVTVPAGIGGLTTSATYLPIKFTATIGVKSVTLYDHWKQPSNSESIQGDIAQSLRTEFDDKTNSGTVAVERICTSTSHTPSIKTLNFGFAWADSHSLGSTLISDEIGTYIADNLAPFKITYTVSLEQVV